MTPAPGDRRGIVVIGAQKAASSTFAVVLGHHPEIAALPEEYFGFVERADDAASVVELSSRLAHLPDRPVYAFKCANYLADGALASRVARALPDIDVVAVLRDPVARAVSAWYWYVDSGWAPIMGHEAGLGMLLDGQFDRAQWPHVAEILDWGEYGRLLAPWVDVFGARLHVFTAAGVSDFDRTLPAFFAQVGLGPADGSLAPDMRANVGVKSLTRLRWRRLRLRRRWHQDADGVHRMGRPRHLFWWLVDAAITVVDRYVLRWACRGHDAVSDDLRSLLQAHYAEDARMLDDVLARASSY